MSVTQLMPRAVKHLDSLTQRLAVAKVFETLNAKEKLYAHYMSRAAWSGARIVLRQVSPEAEGIFDLIMDLYKACGGEWSTLMERCGIGRESLDDFLEYAALFLANLGNYYGEGGQKFTLSLTETAVTQLGSIIARSTELTSSLARSMISSEPANLGFSENKSQSAYYIGSRAISRAEAVAISRALERSAIEPENTRVEAMEGEDQSFFRVLQASTESGSREFEEEIDGQAIKISLQKGDHSDSLVKVCESLELALTCAPSAAHERTIEAYIRSFQTGKLTAYRESQKAWVANKEPKIEDIFGFVESYHDPLGVRAEWEGLVAISDVEETAIFKEFVQKAPEFIRLLPWAQNTVEDDGNGPFEKQVFEAPDFTSIHVLAYCSTIIFEGINLPNYNDIRETCGFKNVIIANRMNANVEGMTAGSLVDTDDRVSLGRCRHRVRFVSTAVHELLGHGAGKLLSEDNQGSCNFDKKNPPCSPVTKQPVNTWYKTGQVWTTVFEDLANTVEECRASLVAAYLMDNAELVNLFGYSKTSEIPHEELLYNTYLLLGIEGVEALRDYSVENKVNRKIDDTYRKLEDADFRQTWGQAHSQGSFAMLNQLLRHSNGCLKVEHDKRSKKVTVKVDRTKILPYAKDALGDMLLKIHVWRCTADITACRPYYKDLTSVTSEHETWRAIVLENPEPRRKFVQGNTFVDGDKIVLKEYKATNEGIIQSWAERAV